MPLHCNETDCAMRLVSRTTGEGVCACYEEKPPVSPETGKCEKFRRRGELLDQSRA
ncbi:hypothetical protein [Pelotomaculum propionicicum]|uniref:hypothetical protein n=1 Tax=Pelotomaculum propionicicum TaxID=258475 RepID=UPI001864799A|nr:hypothetical protein [Pelotomaculum propionicicum]